MIKLKMAAAPAPSQFELDGVIRGYHVYMDDWDARSGELPAAKVDLGNAHDVHANDEGRYGYARRLKVRR